MSLFNNNIICLRHGNQLKASLRDVWNITALLGLPKASEINIHFAKLGRMHCRYTFCVLPLVSICFAGLSHGLEQGAFSIHSVNISRTKVAHDDRFYLSALNVSSCSFLQNVAGDEIDGKCDFVSSTFEMCLFHCRCLGNNSSFMIRSKKCIDERSLMAGKRFPACREL